jgi:hypothetical protein
MLLPRTVELLALSFEPRSCGETTPSGINARPAQILPFMGGITPGPDGLGVNFGHHCRDESRGVNRGHHRRDQLATI